MHADEPVGTPGQPGPTGSSASRARTSEGAVRLRLEIAYDGSDFCGWAKQPGLRSVQGDLEAALRVALRVDAAVPVRVAVAGRTDAGVHSVGQVCHSDVPRASWETAAGRNHSITGTPGAVHQDGPALPVVVRRRLNGLLAPDLRVRHIDVAPAGFEARWSATWRRYSYLVADDPAGQDPRTRGHVLWHPRALDVGRP